MKILQITNSFSPVIGGQEKVVLELSKRLMKRGHEITVLTTDYMCDGEMPEEEEILGIRVIRKKNKYWFAGYGYSPEALSWLLEHHKEFDIVHSHGFNRHLPEFALKIIEGNVPTVFTAHGFIHTQKHKFFKKIHDMTVGKYVSRANICTALTVLDYPEYEKLGVKKENVRELPNGVDVEKFSMVGSNDVIGVTDSYDLDEDYMLCVGRIHESKGIQYVIPTLKNHDMKLVIVGKDAGYKEELENIAKENGVLEKVVFTGPLMDSELEAMYVGAKLFILVSEWEGFGIVAIEAMAAGTPVIASNRGSLPQIITNGENGMIVEYGDSEKLGRVIENILEDRELYNRLKEKGKEYCKKFSWDSVIDATEKIYGEIVRKEGIVVEEKEDTVEEKKEVVEVKEAEIETKAETETSEDNKPSVFIGGGTNPMDINRKEGNEVVSKTE